MQSIEMNHSKAFRAIYPRLLSCIASLFVARAFSVFGWLNCSIIVFIKFGLYLRLLHSPLPSSLPQVDDNAELASREEEMEKMKKNFTTQVSFVAHMR